MGASRAGPVGSRPTPMNRWYVALFVLTTLGCETPREAPPSGERVLEAPGSPEPGGAPVVLPRRGILGDTATWGFPRRLAVVGDFLAVLDRYAPRQVVLVNRHTAEIVGAFGRQGDGPAEMSQVELLYVESHDPPRLWVYDLRGPRFSLWALDDGIPREPLRTFRVNLRGVVPRAYLTDEGIVYTAEYDDAALYVADSAGNIRSTVGTAPYPTTEYRYDATVNLALPVTDPDRRRVALGYHHTNRVEFYDVRGVQIATGAAPVDVPELRLTRADGQRRYERPLPITYGGGAGTSRFVYLAYCPGCDSAMNPPEYRHVQVFDWTGRFVMTLDLGGPSWAIEVTPNDDLLYAVIEDPYPLIVIYQLPAALQGLEAP